MMMQILSRVFFVPALLGMGLGLSLGLSGCKQSAGVQDRVEAARARNDGPPIWRVKDEDTTLYFYGALHVLEADTDWQRSDLEKILSESGVVFFEVSQDEEALSRAQVLTAKHGYFSGGKNLGYLLDGYEKKLLIAATLNAGRKPGELDNMQPWLAANTLTRSELTRAKILPEYGVDRALHKRAKRDGKYLRYLETIDEHLTGSVTLPEHTQLEALRQVMKDAGDLAEQTRALIYEWSRGNAAYIETQVVMPVKDDSPELYDVLFPKRNALWAQKLARFMETETGTASVIVGVGHLVGPDSVIEMLSQRGFEAERYYAYRGENVIKTINLYE